jgi:Adenylate and Guanylate cyclase catalytic domain
MRELPTGTVTMLFSDIEGSTVLLSRLGTRYGEALSAQRSVLRAAISDWHGHEMGTEGDSFFVVFESAADAVACCVAAQRALAGYAWPGGAAVRVRMGLHSGEPLRAARLAGAAAAVRQFAGMPIADVDADLLEGFLAPARATMTPAEWDAEYGAGRALSQDQAAALLLTLEQ